MDISASSPILEHEHEGDDFLDYEEDSYTANGCNCFNVFCFKWRENNNEHRYFLNQNGEQQHSETWLVKHLKKVREVSEKIAGPKWKTFIRKIGGYVKNKKKNRNYQFQYDAESYALNFDGGFEREDDGLAPNFSSRFTAPLVDPERPAKGPL